MKIIKSAGLAIIKNNRLLLVHPTNNKWWNTYSIPKGEVNKHESILNAAIRETFEEIGIKFKKEEIDPEEHCIEYKNKSGIIYKKVFYFVVRLDDDYQIDNKINKNSLQLEEVDWAGFLTKKNASKRIFYRLKSILNEIKSVKK